MFVQLQFHVQRNYGLNFNKMWNKTRRHGEINNPNKSFFLFPYLFLFFLFIKVQGIILKLSGYYSFASAVGMDMNIGEIWIN